MTQEVIDQLAARRAARDAEYQRHGNQLTDAKLIDMAAIGKARTAPLPPIPHAAGTNVVAATSMADFLDKYRNAGPATIDLGDTVLDFGGNQFVMDRANVYVDGGTLQFNRPGGNATVPEKQCYGIVLAAPGAGFGQRTKIRSNRGVLWTDNSGCSGLTFSADVQSGSAAKYYTPAIWSGVGAVGWRIVYAYFHDSQGSDRTLELWGAANLDYSFCRFDNVKDGGHLMENGGKIRMVSNLFTKLGRMGIEVQGNAVSDDFLFENNVAYGWVNPYFDCELISMCAVNMTGVKIRKNYARNDFTGPWGNVQDQGQRFGIAIEAMTADNGCTVEDNDIGGPNRWACIVAAGSKNMLVRNMRVYGAQCVWGDYVPEPGTRGQGTIQDGGGNQRFTSPMPDPPNPITGGGGGGGSPVITNVKATEANPPVVTWTGGVATITRTDKAGKTDTNANGSPAVFANASSPFTDTSIPQEHYDHTWEVLYNVGGTVSNVVNLPKSTVTPPPPGGYIVTTEAEIDGAGKVLNSKVTTKPRTVAP